MVKLSLIAVCFLIFETSAAPVTIYQPREDIAVTILDNTTLNTEIFEVQAENLDIYSYDQDLYEGMFSWEEDYPYLYIKTAKPLVAGEYTLTIRAFGTDGSSDTRKITIIVKSPATNLHAPVFTGTVGSANIVEDANIGTKVTRVTAEDADTISPENTVTYSISGTDFSINSSTGWISVKTNLNYTNQKTYSLLITATDGGSTPKSATTSFSVTVETRPVWMYPLPEEGAARFDIAETSQSQKIVDLLASDEDGSILNYVLSDEAAKFHIDNNSLYTNSEADFDVDAEGTVTSYTFVVSVNDGKYSATSNVTIEVSVSDENDNIPSFDPANYEVSIPVDHPREISVLNISACDNDLTSPNNVVEYSLQDNSTFVIDPSTGIIYLGRTSVLSYVDLPLYHLVVIANDRGHLAQSASVNVTIRIKTKPIWLDPPPDTLLTKFIKEGSRSSKHIITLSAKDDDNSSSLLYMIDSQIPATPVLFVIEENELKTTFDAVFDVDAASAVQSYTLNLRVQDDEFSAFTVLNVSLLDVNDHIPKFSQDNYSRQIDENHPLDTTVLQVHAEDGDKEFNIISYSFHGEVDILSLDPDSGAITLKGVPQKPLYSATLIATDNGTPLKSATVALTIQINADVVDECVGINCSNGGSCQGSVNAFECKCEAGWEGQLCENNIDDCAGSKCLNGGSCIDGNNGFICNCTQGWTGITCNEACTNNTFGFNCLSDCICESSKVTTDSIILHQLCDVKNGTCICKSEWYGDRCEHDTDECANETICNAFENKACVNLVGGYFCGCVLGFTEDEDNDCVLDTETRDYKPNETETDLDVSIALNSTRSYNLRVTSVHKNISRDLEEKLRAIFPHANKVLVTELKSGSLLVDFIIFIPSEEKSKMDTAIKLQELRDGLPFNLLNETVSTMSMNVSGVPLYSRASTDKDQLCEVYNAAFDCPFGHVCEIVDDIPSCIEIPVPKDNTALILGLGLGVTLPGIFLVIVVVIIGFKVVPAARNQRRRDERSKKNRTIYQYEERQFRPYIFYSGRKYNTGYSHSSTSHPHDASL